MIDHSNDRKHDASKPLIVVTAVYAFVAWGLFIAGVFV